MASKKSPALGRGLDALFGSGPPPKKSTGTQTAPKGPAPKPQPEGPYHVLPIDKLNPNPFQPRRTFDDDRLGDLAESIKAQGILQPIVVRKSGKQFQIIAGERRWRAAQTIGLTEVPVILKDFDDLSMTQAAIVENVQRENLNPAEEAEGYYTLANQFGMKQDLIAKAVGKSRVSVSNSMRLLKLPPEILELVRQEKLTPGHARAVLSLTELEDQHALAREIVAQQMNVRDAEALAHKYKEKRARVASGPKIEAHGGKKAPNQGRGGALGDIEEKLSLKLGMRVQIDQSDEKSGKIIVNYASLDDFEAACEALGLDVQDLY